MGVNTIANVFINGKHVGEHRGGYTAFAYEITDFVNYGKKNNIWVRVNNAPQLDIIPLVGDFNFYGGIYRDVDLYVTDKDCISLLDHGSEGVYLYQEKVSKENAKVKTLVKTLGKDADNLVLIVLDHENNIVVSKKQALKANDSNQIEIPFEIEKPHLWNGKKDPYLYSVVVELQKKME